MFPLMKIEDLRQAKINISIHTSNSFSDCEKMFIPDFLELDAELGKYLEQKQEEEGNLLENIGSGGF
jgi:hypothetical protein